MIRPTLRDEVDRRMLSVAYSCPVQRDGELVFEGTLGIAGSGEVRIRYATGNGKAGAARTASRCREC